MEEEIVAKRRFCDRGKGRMAEYPGLITF